MEKRIILAIKQTPNPDLIEDHPTQSPNEEHPPQSHPKFQDQSCNGRNSEVRQIGAINASTYSVTVKSSTLPGQWVWCICTPESTLMLPWIDSGLFLSLPRRVFTQISCRQFQDTSLWPKSNCVAPSHASVVVNIALDHSLMERSGWQMVLK